jgi:1-aminocyclopropane-1-carboxylate deaminase/D-cysteine desulfhydrase-like pyridoxal-dependent ACC family enzyme
VHGFSKGVGVDYSRLLHEETPVERRGSLFFKRDDLFEFAGMRGAKVRAALSLCLRAKDEGFSTVVSACSRHSPQLAILGAVGRELGLLVEGFVAEGSDSPIMRRAVASGVNLHRVVAGYSVVVQARAREYAGEHGCFLVPFGMAGSGVIALTEHQAVALYSGEGRYSRVVMVAGSGVNMAGVLRGLAQCGAGVPVVGVLVGHDCRPYVGENNLGAVPVSFVRSPIPYDESAIYSNVNGVEVDARYEGKAVPFLCPGDLFWVVGFVSSNTVPVGRVI